MLRILHNRWKVITLLLLLIDLSIDLPELFPESCSRPIKVISVIFHRMIHVLLLLTLLIAMKVSL